MRTVVDDKSYMVIFCDGDNSYYIILEFIFDIFVIPLLLLTRNFVGQPQYFSYNVSGDRH
jgi:hypothetical protein